MFCHCMSMRNNLFLFNMVLLLHCCGASRLKLTHSTWSAIWACNFKNSAIVVPVVCLMLWVVGLGSSGPEFNSHLAIGLIPSGVDSACHPSEVGRMSTSLLGWLGHLSLLFWSGDLSRIVPNSPGDYFGSTDTLYRVSIAQFVLVLKSKQDKVFYELWF